MMLGARPGFVNLYRDFGDRVQFVNVYVREAHPGENYPRHTSEEQKIRHARDWVEQDRMPGMVAVDTLDGATHQAYGPLPNSVYLIDRAGRVALRALWAGQEGLLRDKIEELLKREAAGETGVNLGQRENLIIPLIPGGHEFDYVATRRGEKSKEDFRREMGKEMYGLQKLISKMRRFINPGNNAVRIATDRRRRHGLDRSHR